MCKRCNDFQISYEHYQKFIADLRLLTSERKISGKALYSCAERNGLSHAIINTLFEYKVISVAWDQYVEVDLNGFDRDELYNVKFHFQSEDNLIHFIHQHETLLDELSQLRKHSLNCTASLLNQSDLNEHHCEHCNNRMPEGSKGKYCSLACEILASNLPALKFQKERRCANCNGLIPEGKRIDSVYCSDTCRHFAKRQRQKSVDHNEPIVENKNVQEPSFFEIIISLVDMLISEKKSQNPQSDEKK